MVEEKERAEGKVIKENAWKPHFCNCVCVCSNNCLFCGTCCPSLSFSFGFSEVLTVFELICSQDHYIQVLIYLLWLGPKGSEPGACECLRPQVLRMQMFKFVINVFVTVAVHYCSVCARA